jgi:hypothetical protein
MAHWEHLRGQQGSGTQSTTASTAAHLCGRVLQAVRSHRLGGAAAGLDRSPLLDLRQPIPSHRVDESVTIAAESRHS